MDNSEIQVRSIDEVGMERIDSSCSCKHAGDGINYSIEAKQLAFLIEEIVGELRREKYFCELLNKA